MPRGANLVRLDGYHATLDPGTYDGPGLETQLAAMAALGYNAVRIFHDHRAGGLVSGDAEALSPAYLDDAVDFLWRARAHGIQVLFTQDWLPDAYPQPPSPGVAGINSQYLSAGGVAANARFFGDFVDGLLERGAPMDTILGYELRNELYFDGSSPPFSQTAGTVTPADGRSYDLARAADRRAIVENGIVHWADAVRAEIRRHDPTALVGIGFFVPQEPNPARPGDTRIVETAKVIASSSLDFVDLHAYPKADLPLPGLLQNFGVARPPAKVLLMGEMGAFRNLFDAATGAQALVSWEADSCSAGFDGWLLWTWDSAGGADETWNATDDGGLIAAALAPLHRADPCSAAGGEPRDLALGRPATASATLSGSPPGAAVDGSPETLWSAGTGPTQWIRIDLGKVPPVGAIVRLTVSQTPAGRTRHVLLGGPNPASLRVLHVFDGSTADLDVLTFQLATSMTNVRYLEVETTASPSWVAWREIEVSAP